MARSVPRSIARPLVVLALLPALSAAVGVSRSAAAAPAPAHRAAAVDPATIAPVTAYAALPALTAVQALFAAGQIWLPEYPSFSVPPETWVDQQPGERSYVNQSFLRVSDAPAELQLALHVYDSAADAGAAFDAAATDSNADAGGAVMDGPSLADAQRYYTRPSSPEDSTAGMLMPNESTVRLLLGPLVARLTLVTGGDFESSAALAALAQPLLAGMQALLAGQVNAPAVDPSLLALLPPAVTGIGPDVGTVAAPPQVWAASDDVFWQTGSLDELKRELQLLQAGGVQQLVIRNLALTADPRGSLLATLIPARDAASAQSVVTDYAQEISLLADTTLPADPSIPNSVYASFSNTGSDELQFSAGRYAADVSCLPPAFDNAPVPACDAAVRQLAEGWYSLLSAAGS